MAITTEDFAALQELASELTPRDAVNLLRSELDWDVRSCISQLTRIKELFPNSLLAKFGNG